MAGFGKNREIIGAVILLLLLSGRQGGTFPGKLFSQGGFNLSELAANLRLGDFARDLHHIVDIMDQMNALSQMGEMMEKAGPLLSMLTSQNEPYNE